MKTKMMDTEQLCFFSEKISSFVCIPTYILHKLYCLQEINVLQNCFVRKLNNRSIKKNPFSRPPASPSHLQEM